MEYRWLNGKIQRAEQWARETWAKTNLPDPDSRIVIHADGSWTPFLGDYKSVRIGEVITFPIELARRKYGPESDASYAASVLSEIRRLKTCVELGEIDLAMTRAWEIGDRLAERDMAPDAARGLKFQGNKRGESALKKLLREILGEMGGEASNAEIWARLDHLARQEHNIIHDVEGVERVYWISASGKEKRTSFKQVANLLSDIRKEA